MLRIDLLAFTAIATLFWQGAMRYQLSDDLWQRFEPLIHKVTKSRQGVKPELPDRLFVEATLYVGRTGIPWRDLPSEFGAWDAVYNLQRPVAAAVRTRHRRANAGRGPQTLRGQHGRARAPARQRAALKKGAQAAGA